MVDFCTIYFRTTIVDTGQLPLESIPLSSLLLSLPSVAALSVGCVHSLPSDVFDDQNVHITNIVYNTNQREQYGTTESEGYEERNTRKNTKV